MLCCSLMFYCCRNLTDVCLAKQGGSRFPPPLRGQGATLKTILNLDHTQRTRHQSMRFSGSSLILSCLMVSSSCGIVYSRAKRTPESENKKPYVYISHQTENQKENVGVRTRYLYTLLCFSTRRRCELQPFQQREVILEDGI